MGNSVFFDVYLLHQILSEKLFKYTKFCYIATITPHSVRNTLVFCPLSVYSPSFATIMYFRDHESVVESPKMSIRHRS